MKKITAALVGAGARGEIYASYAQRHPHELQVMAIAEPDAIRRDSLGASYQIPNDLRFNSWEDLLNRPQFCDALLICTQDRMHFEPAVKAIERGYHILLEKPISPNPWECLEIGRLSERTGKVFMICYVLRFTSFFSTLKKLLEQGIIGRTISVQHNENIGFWHHAHSFVRGNWRNSNESSPMILAKSCHDMDILLYLTGASCTRLSSFGSLTYFKEANAPEGAPDRCTDGCPAEKDCPYSAIKLYLDTPGDCWPVSVISADISMNGRLEALKNGPYGRCVFKCDNNVVDHQVVNMEFDNGVTAAFTMCAFTAGISRTIKIMGTLGEIRGHMERNEIEIHNFTAGTIDLIKLPEEITGHGGGDNGIMSEFIRQVRGDEPPINANQSVQSHLMAFAAEESRITCQVIDFRNFMNRRNVKKSSFS